MMAKKRMSFALALAVAVVGSVPALAKPPAHLVPFPEDQAQSAPAQAAQPQPPKSNFRPRFRLPAVKQANHEEPAATPAGDPQQAIQQAGHEEPAAAEAAPQPLPAEPQSAADPQLLPTQAPQTPSHSTGREALNEAYALSKTASAADDYTQVIHLCRRAKATGLDQKYDDYAHQLLGWAFNRRGEARSRDGQHAEALDDFERAVAASGAWRAVHNRGVGYAALGRLKEAMADLNRAIALNPRYSHAYFNRGELRYKFKDYPGAVKDYATAIKLGADDAAVYSSRGHAYYRMQRFGDALRDYGEAIKLDPEDAAALVNRGDTYSDVGKYGLAAKDYRAAVRVTPNNGRAYQAVAWLMATCPDSHYREEELAIEAASRAIELSGSTFRNLSTLAAAQANAGMYPEAQETQERAIAAATKKDVVTAEKMMSLYRREIAYRDRPFTAFKTPDDLDDKEVRQATAVEPARPRTRGGRQIPRQAQRAWFQEPARGLNRLVPRQPPSQNRGPGRPPKARLFGPRGRI